jgi:hypothetical protein
MEKCSKMVIVVGTLLKRRYNRKIKTKNLKKIKGEAPSNQISNLYNNQIKYNNNNHQAKFGSNFTSKN